MKGRLPALPAVAVLTALSYFQFPGHTWLQSDTQIYAPILETQWDPSVFKREIIAQQPHVSFTIYDETALALRGLTRAPFRTVLAIEQVTFRAAGIAGVYLLAAALGLSAAPAILVTAAFTLGATIAGPAILTFEYEPAPRGFALGLVMLALGLVAHGRYLWAGAAASLAFLYHVPAVYPFWLMYAVMTLRAPKRFRISGFIPLGVAIFVLIVLSRTQTGAGESQEFFQRIDAAQEELQRLRASYNWVSMWPAGFYWHHLLLFTAAMAACWRLRTRIPGDLQVFLIGMPVAGLCSVPLSYLLLERLKWSLVPQFQPARALLFGTVVAVIGAAAAGAIAAQRRSFLEAGVWFFLVYAIPLETRTLWDLTPRRMLIALTLAICATAAVWIRSRGPRVAAWCAIAAAAALPFVLIPDVGGVRNYPALHSVELSNLAAWARGDTDREAMFLFPDAGRSLEPGIFRAEALRAVYVDWKGGGQINFLRDFATVWWSRWQAAMARPFAPGDLERLRTLGVDYVILRAGNRQPGLSTAYENTRYVVYRTNPLSVLP